MTHLRLSASDTPVCVCVFELMSDAGVEETDAPAQVFIIYQTFCRGLF